MDFSFGPHSNISILYAYLDRLSQTLALQMPDLWKAIMLLLPLLLPSDVVIVTKNGLIYHNLLTIPFYHHSTCQCQQDGHAIKYAIDK